MVGHGLGAELLGHGPSARLVRIDHGDGFASHFGIVIGVETPGSPAPTTAVRYALPYAFPFKPSCPAFCRTAPPPPLKARRGAGREEVQG